MIGRMWKKYHEKYIKNVICVQTKTWKQCASRYSNYS